MIATLQVVAREAFDLISKPPNGQTAGAAVAQLAREDNSDQATGSSRPCLGQSGRFNTRGQAISMTNSI
jgi:hypothetical protein